jgi:hypothetical protein
MEDSDLTGFIIMVRSKSAVVPIVDAIVVYLHQQSVVFSIMDAILAYLC